MNGTPKTEIRTPNSKGHGPERGLSSPQRCLSNYSLKPRNTRKTRNENAEPSAIPDSRADSPFNAEPRRESSHILDRCFRVFRGSLGRFWAFGFGGWTLFATLALGVLPWLSAANTNPIAANEIPPLLPPRPELPPTIWEQYGPWLVTAGVLIVGLLALSLWFLLRPKPLPAVPPHVQARNELDRLAQQQEDGALLSRVSQILCHYIAAVFRLPPAELTTAEFCQAISAVEQIGPELTKEVSEFLRECDRRKFAPSAPGSPLGAVPRAFKLIELSESRRAEVTQAAVGQIRTPRAS